MNYILEMKDVTKKFPGVLALNKVTLQLKKGEILGICGENGSRKIYTDENFKWNLPVWNL